ncbi:MAG: MMPL family transporter, partial [Thermoguttaceae bacterium]|nr:MMPL family transporter [Thermoguttaceae bacterium]
MKKDFFKEYGFRIIFIVVFLLAFVWMGTKQTIRSNSNSVEDWLPPQYQQTRDYKWYLEHFPFESYVVVSWEGCTLDDEDRIELFAQKLVPGQTIDNYSLMGVSPKLKAELDLKEVPERVTQEINRLAAGQERTLESGADADTESVRGARTTEASPETKEEPAYFKSVMTGPRLIRLLEQTYAKVQSRQSPEEIHQEIINRLKGTLIGPDGRSTALIITLNKGKRDGKSLKLVLNKIREISLECGLPDTTEVVTGSLVDRMVKNLTDMFREIAYGRTVRMDGIIMGGPPVDNVALDQEGVRTLYRLAGICAFIGVSIAFICLRSIRLTMFVFWIAILSAGVALAIVSLTGGTCDSILLSMPALVYVLAMSGSVHLINYYHDTIREQGLQGATEQAVRHAFPPCFFAQLTTAIGLGSLFVGRLVPITKFGFYSAIGVLITLLLLFFYLPALLYFYPSKKFAAKYGGTGLHNKNETISTFWSYYGRFIVKYHNLVALVCLIIMGFFAYYLPSIKTSVKMMSFFSSDAEIIKHYDWLEGKLGPLVPMETVISFDNSKLDPSTFGVAERLRLMNTISQQLTEKLSEDVGGTLSAATFAPDVEMFGRPGSIYYRMASAVIGKAVDENRESLKDYITIEGNPSLDEMDRYLTQKAEKVLKEYEQKKNALNERLQAKGMTLDEIQILSTRESRSEAETEILDEFTADIQDFEEIANKSLQLE